MTVNPSDISQAALGIFKRELVRSRDTLVPPAFQFLWETPRYLVAYGGRGAAKSWSIARVLLILANERPLRIMVCREIMSSIKESAFRLLCDQIQRLELSDYIIRADSIGHRNGTEIFFEHLRYNDSRIRSIEGVNICWVEEAQSVSDRSWETLTPTLRAEGGSRFVISYNPMRPDDPVAVRFVDSKRVDVIARKVSWRDNLFLSPEAHAEREWLERADPDAYKHVWEGFPRTVTDALILRNKYFLEDFTVDSRWAGPYHGCDFGFARDPNAAVRCYVDDVERVLYITHEYWALGVDTDALPGALEVAIPGISRHVVYCDSARPETTSYLQRYGIPNARNVEKWPGSVDDGIAFLRQFSRIVINPACKHLIDECGSYSFKTDRLTGVPLPEPEGKNDHLIDSLRYALSPLIRNQPAGTYFNRAALLVNGEPVEPPRRGISPARSIFLTAALCDRPGTAVGVIFWAYWPHGEGIYPLRILDYVIGEVDEVLTLEAVTGIFRYAQELRVACHAIELTTALWVAEGELHTHLVELAQEVNADIDVCRIDPEGLPPTLDERASQARVLVNVGDYVKLTQEAYSGQVTHRSVTSNHLLSQVLGFRPGMRDVANELTNAFVIGCLTPGGERRLYGF